MDRTETKEYLESANGAPGELRVSYARNNEAILLEQDSDVIWLDDQQASALIKSLTRFLKRV